MFKLENGVLEILRKYTGIKKETLIIQKLVLEMSSENPTTIEMKAIYKEE